MNSKESRRIIREIAEDQGLEEETVGEIVRSLLLSVSDIMKNKADKRKEIFPTISVKGLGKFLISRVIGV